MPSPQASPSLGNSKVRRLLIATGTSQYDKIPSASLPRIEEEVELIAKLFTEQLGYTRVLPTLDINPTSAQLRTSLGAFFSDAARNVSDIVALYYSGHGVSTDRHYLLTSDSEEHNLAGTAFAAEELGWMLEQSCLQHLLIMLDTCYSGYGTGDLSAVVARLSNKKRVDESQPSGIYAIASSRPRQEALQGAFAKALVEAVNSPSQGGANQPYLDPVTLMSSINSRLRQHNLSQRANMNTTGVATQAYLIPNPRYRSWMPAGLDLATQQGSSGVNLNELISHWGPRARGVEIESQAGWYFSGRTTVLSELIMWLRSLDGDHRARVVTGSPGSGKSAVLARIVTLSDSEYRRRTPLSQISPELIPPEDCVNAAIHAKGRTTEEIVARIGDAAGVAAITPEILVHALSRLEFNFCLVVDGLDEAVNPRRLAREVLQPLSLVTRVKLLVGTRRTYLNSLGPAIKLVDLDDPKYIGESDLCDYVKGRLLGAANGSESTPYRKKPEIAEKVAKAIARKAYPNFLIARTVSSYLINGEDIIDTNAQGWDRIFPGSVGEAFEEYLAHFGSDMQRVRDLFLVLAYAEGSGLPWAPFWPSLATAISGRTYTDDDIVWLLDKAGAFVVESVEHDASVYRLYHQAFADHLRFRDRDTAVQQSITKVLIESVPPSVKTTQKDWFAAHPYVWDNLARHAVSAGRLDELVTDPGFLLSAEPTRLIHLLHFATSNAARQAARAYQVASHRLKYGPRAEAASYLELAARQIGANDLADHIGELPLERSWCTLWARWQPFSSHRVIGKVSGKVHSMGLCEHGGRTLLVCAGSRQLDTLGELRAAEDTVQEEIEIWDLETSEKVSLTVDERAWTSGASVYTLASRRAMAEIQFDKVHIRDLDRGTIIASIPFDYMSEKVTAATLIDFHGRMVLITAESADEFRGKSAIRARDIDANAKPSKLILESKCQIRALTAAEWNGTVVLISAGDDSTIRFHHFHTGTELFEIRTKHLAGIDRFWLGKAGGRTMLCSVSVSGMDREVRLWDIDQRSDLCILHVGQTSWFQVATIGELDGNAVTVSVGHDALLRLWPIQDARDFEIAQGPRHTGQVDSVTAGNLDGRSVAVSGGDDGSVRLWELCSGEQIAASRGAIDAGVQAVAITTISGRGRVAALGSFGKALVWDLKRNFLVVSTLYPSTELSWTVFIRKVLRSMFPMLRDAELALGRHLWSAAIAVLGRDLVAITGEDDGSLYVWNLKSGRESGPRFPYVGDPSQIKTFRHAQCIAIGTVRGRTIIVSSCWNEPINVWDYGTRSLITQLQIGADNGAHAMTIGAVGDHQMIIVGDMRGRLLMWNAETLQLIGKPIRAHTDSIGAVAIGGISGRRAIVSGGYDGRFKCWTPQGVCTDNITVGASITALSSGVDSTFVMGTEIGLLAIKFNR